MDEDELLGEMEDAEMAEKRTTDLIRALIGGERPKNLTETEIKEAETALKKAWKGLAECRKTMLTDEEILGGVSKLHVFSPPANSPKPSDNLDSIRRDYLDESMELLDYEESIDGGDEEDVIRDSPAYMNDSPAPSPALEFFSDRTVKMEVQNSPPSIICLSSDDEDDEEKPSSRSMNVGDVDFMKKVDKENPYLRFEESKVRLSTGDIGLTYPLGVTYDRKMDTWYVTNEPTQNMSGDSKLVRIRILGNSTMHDSLTHPMLTFPSSIAVYREGSEIAILCRNRQKMPSINILKVNPNNEDDLKVYQFCDFRMENLDFRHPARGLAISKGGNLVTCDTVNRVNRLRVFARDPSNPSRIIHRSFPLQNTNCPSFIASHKHHVAISDIPPGDKSASVLLVHLDDSDMGNVKFEVTRVISSAGVHSDMRDDQFFKYPAGIQFDKNGNLIVADARNYLFKLFKPGLRYNHRISTDFPVPYVSAFHVNRFGEVLIVSTRGTNKIHVARLTSSNRLQKYVNSGAGRREGMKVRVTRQITTMMKN